MPNYHYSKKIAERLLLWAKAKTITVTFLWLEGISVTLIFHCYVNSSTYSYMLEKHCTHMQYMSVQMTCEFVLPHSGGAQLLSHSSSSELMHLPLHWMNGQWVAVTYKDARFCIREKTVIYFPYWINFTLIFIWKNSEFRKKIIYRTKDLVGCNSFLG